MDRPIVTLQVAVFRDVWVRRGGKKSAGLGLGFIVGGALGNAYDRLAYGFVADFYHFHVGSFSWYVFNLADAAIVAGVALLICASLSPANKSREINRAPGK